MTTLFVRTRNLKNRSHKIKFTIQHVTGLHWVFRWANETLVSLQDSAANDGIRFSVPKPTEWQHTADQIDAASIFARSDFVNVHGDVRFIDWLGVSVAMQNRQ